jgi:hypothetical protein
VRISPPGVVGGTEDTLSLSSTEFPILRPHLRHTTMCVRRQTTKCLQLIAFLTSPSASVNQKTRYLVCFPHSRTSRDTLNTPRAIFPRFTPVDDLIGRILAELKRITLPLCW